MSRNILAWLMIPVLLVTLSGNALARLEPQPIDRQALIAVAINSSRDLIEFQRSGLQVFTRWPTEHGQMIVSGATQSDLHPLSEAGLFYITLDQKITGEDYYFVDVEPGHVPINYEGYGKILFEGLDQILLKATPESIKQLVDDGVHVMAINLEPKPLGHPVDQFKTPTLLEPDPDVQDMIDLVDPSTVYTYSGNLTGLWPVMIDGIPYTISTRTTTSGEPIEKATRLVGTHLENLGFNVEYHSWAVSNYSGTNVIGQRTGFSRPEDIFIIGAHLDNLPYGAIAPGMDDNASGSIGVLIAADILSQHHWDCTLRFIFWTGEEQGLQGSRIYAERSATNAENIRAVLNLDMIAWNTAGSDPTIELHATTTLTPTLEMAQLFVDVVDTYQLNLDPVIISNGTNRSDHASFWNNGYPAILGIEEFFGGDFNPNYHTIDDTYGNLQDISYFVEYIKGAVATYAHLAGCQITEGLGTLSGDVTESESGAPLDDALITAETASGYNLSHPVSAGGSYTTSLVSGVYTITVSAAGYLPMSVYPVDIFTDTVTIQDFVLELPDLTYFPVYKQNGP